MQAPLPTDLPGAVALSSFFAQDESEHQFTDELRQILEVIAWTGNYWHEWSMLKCLLAFCLKQVLMQYYESHTASGGQQTLVSGETFSELQNRLLEGLDLFVDGPPFTLQRICELLLNPRLTYPNLDKVALAFEKVLLVTSTVLICRDPYPAFPESEGQHRCDQTSDQQQINDSVEANGVPEGRTISDEEITDVMLQDKQSDGADNLPLDEACLSSRNKLSFNSEASQSHLPDSEKMFVHGESPLMEEELVDISLDEQK